MNDYLKQILDTPESANCQFKSAPEKFDFEEAVKICCALANGGGGKLILGITDKRPRQVTGSNAFEQPERTIETLINRLKINLNFELLYDEEKRVLIFNVSNRPIGLPVYSKGIAWWYMGDSLVPLPASELKRIYEESGEDFSAKICPGATIEDLDKKAIEYFVSNWVKKSGNEKLQSESYEQILFDCDAINDDGITNAALILFGKAKSITRLMPCSEIIYEFRLTESSGPADYRENIRDAAFLTMQRIFENVNIRNSVHHYQEGLFVFDIRTFNERVVREALLNAISHRNYQYSSSVFIRHYTNHIKIESPGGLPRGVTIENILYKQNPRNRRIAEIFEKCGLVERSGQGMDLMFEYAVREAKHLPDFKDTDEHNVVLTISGLVYNSKMISIIQDIVSQHQNSLIVDDFLYIDCLMQNKPINNKILNRTNHLLELGIIERAGRKKIILSQALYSALGLPGVHTRKKGLDNETNKELLLKHIKTIEPSGAALNELSQVLPNLSIHQVQYLMRSLKAEGKVCSFGRGGAAKWHLSN